MKKMLLTVAAMTALAAAPAFAETHHPHRATTDAYSTYAAAPGYAAGPNTVIRDGQLVGADPDPNIRYQLERDPPWNVQ